jgi:hypothetical protein
VSRPGTAVTVSDVLPSAAAPTATDVLFVVGETREGPLDVQQVRSLASFTSYYGDRFNPADTFDAVEAFFRDGGGRAYVKRLVPDDATVAEVDAGDFTVSALGPGASGDTLRLELLTGTGQRRAARPVLTLAGPPPSRQRAADALTVTFQAGVEDGKAQVGSPVRISVTDADDNNLVLADLASINWGDGSPLEPTTWEHTYDAPASGVVIQVEADEGGDTGSSEEFDVAGPGGGGPFGAVVEYDGRVVERSPISLETVADLVGWAADSDWVRVTGDDETVALASGRWGLSGGSDGTLPVSDPYLLLEAALGIPAALGPGQLIAPGKVAAAQHEALLAGAENGNRAALLDADPSLDEAGLVAHVRQLRGLDSERFGGLFGPRAVVPGRAPGTTRLISWSGIQAGLIARLDGGGNPNRAAAGSFGQSRWAIDLETEFDDVARERLMHAGVNTARVLYGTVRSYGFRTIVDENGPNRGWLLLSNVRLAMAIKARADAVAERYVFANLDGRGRTLARFGGELSGICMDYWPEALYGDTPEEAFRVDTGDSVNTPETIANLEIHAVILLRMAPFGEWVEVQIVKQAITESLA